MQFFCIFFCLPAPSQRKINAKQSVFISPLWFDSYKVATLKCNLSRMVWKVTVPQKEKKIWQIL